MRYIVLLFWFSSVALGAYGQVGQDFDPTKCKPSGAVIECEFAEGAVVNFTPQMFAAMMGGEYVESDNEPQVVVQAAPEITKQMQPAAKTFKSPEEAFDKAKLRQALNDVIVVDARGWMFNRYNNNSVRNVRVYDFSDDLKSYTVYGDYTFNGNRKGFVEVRLNDGELGCLKFWDSPSCRPLGQSHSQGIVAGAIMGAVSDTGSSPYGGGQSENCQLERIGGQVQRICY